MENILTGNFSEFINQAASLLPEMILVTGGLLLLLTELFNSEKRIVIIKFIYLLVLLSAFLLALFQQLPFSKFQTFYVWDVILLDRASLIFSLIFVLAGGFFLISYWKRVTSIELFLALMMVLGAFLVVKAIHLLVLLLAIEILSISAYSLSAIQHTEKAKEASIKYIIFGGVSTAIFLFGISLLFGFTNTLNIGSELFTQNLIEQEAIILMVVFILIFVGLFFKITAFPFHLWAPDIYEAVPGPVAAFFSIVPKIAVLGFIIKFSLAINLFNIIEIPWELFMAVIAMITMTIGNLAALSQENAKRMLAYSSIAHTGFFLMAIVGFSVFAYQAMIFYAVVYLLMNFAAFALVHFYEEKFGFDDIKSYRGLAKSFPFHAIILVVIMIALTGLPPTAGFTAKLFVFTAVWEAWQSTSMEIFWILLIVGIVNTVFSLFYYLKIPYYMIFKETDEKLASENSSYFKVNFLLVILVLPLLILFIRPDILMEWINMINFVL